jgi:predicted MFS family arabinose efflux permease
VLTAEAVGWRVVFLALAPLVALAAVLVLPALWRHGEAGTGPARPAAGAARDRRPRAGDARRARPVGPLAVRALVVFAFFGVESFLPLALAQVRGAGAGTVAGLLTLSALAWTAGAFLQARLCARYAAPVLARGGGLALLAGIGCALAALFESTPLGVALAGWAVAGLGMGVAYQTATASTMAASPPGAEGATGAALGLVDALSSASATALGGALLGAAPLAPGVAPVFVFTAFGLAAGAGAASLLAARHLRAPAAV